MSSSEIWFHKLLMKSNSNVPRNWKRVRRLPRKKKEVNLRRKKRKKRRKRGRLHPKKRGKRKLPKMRHQRASRDHSTCMTIQKLLKVKMKRNNLTGANLPMEVPTVNGRPRRQSLFQHHKMFLLVNQVKSSMLR